MVIGSFQILIIMKTMLIIRRLVAQTGCHALKTIFGHNNRDMKF